MHHSKLVFRMNLSIQDNFLKIVDSSYELEPHISTGINASTLLYSNDKTGKREREREKRD